MRTITKAVFPVAGFGSRFLPATKASPKEMLPVVDKPLIQYAVEEAVAAGHHRDDLHHRPQQARDRGPLRQGLRARDRARAARQDTSCSSSCRRHHCPRSSTASTSARPRRSASATRCCAREPVVGDEPFAVMLADDLIDGEPPVMKQMVDVFAREDASVLGVHGRRAGGHREPTASSKPTRIDERLRVGRGASSRSRSPEAAPSTLAVVGRYVLTPRIFHHLRTRRRRARAARSSSPTGSRAAAGGARPRLPVPRARATTAASKLGYLAGDRRARAQAPGGRPRVRRVARRRSVMITLGA